MNAHEGNICAALASGVYLDLDPGAASSALLRAWLRGAREISAQGRPVSVSTLSEYAAPVPLPPVPKPSVLEDSIAAVEEAATERRVRAALESTARGYRFVDSVLNAATASGGRIKSASMGSVLTTELDALKRGEVRARFVPTGIAEVDAELNGLPRGVVSVMGARPGIGKSASALACADGAATAGHGVHVFSLEDPAWRYAHRLIAKRTGIPTGSIASAGAVNVPVPPNWLIDDHVGHTARSICRAARAQSKLNDTRLVVVDYVQLLRDDTIGVPEHTKLQGAMAEFSGLARDLDAAVLVISQLNRNTTERVRPSMADLKASGSLEEVAKLVILIARPNQEESDDVIEWHVAKNNFGKVKTLSLGWNGACSRIW